MSAGAPLELVLLIGLQASGKTTFVRSHFSEHVHLSKDLLRSARNKEARLQRELRAALEAGRSVVIDNTQPHPKDRAALIEIGHAFGARVVGYFFVSRLRDSLARNERRTGRARVPETGLLVTAQRLRRPTREEGFDALHEVTLTEAGAFVVR